MELLKDFQGTKKRARREGHEAERIDDAVLDAAVDLYKHSIVYDFKRIFSARI